MLRIVFAKRKKKNLLERCQSHFIEHSDDATLNHGYNWCCYYELVFFFLPPSKTKKIIDLVEGVCVWVAFFDVSSSG